MAVFIWPVSYGSSEDLSLGIKRVKLGEGYVQRRQEVINSQRSSWPVRVKNTIAYCETIKQFIRTNGRIGFDWTPPGGSTPVRVTDRKSVV